MVTIDIWNPSWRLKYSRESILSTTQLWSANEEPRGYQPHFRCPCVYQPHFWYAPENVYVRCPRWELCDTCALHCQHLLRTATFASPALPATYIRRKTKPWWISLFSAAPFTGLAALSTLPMCTFGQKAWRGFLASGIVTT